MELDSMSALPPEEEYVWDSPEPGCTLRYHNREDFVIGIIPCQCDECDNHYLAKDTPFGAGNKQYCRSCELTHDRYETVETPFGIIDLVRTQAIEEGAITVSLPPLSEHSFDIETAELPITSMLQQQRQDMEEQMIQGIGSDEFSQMLEQQQEYTTIRAEQGVDLSMPNRESLSLDLSHDNGGPDWLERFRNMSPMTFAQEFLGSPDGDDEDETDLFEALHQDLPTRTRRATSLRGARISRVRCPRCDIEYHSNNNTCPRCELRNPRRNPNEGRRNVTHCPRCSNNYSSRLGSCPTCGLDNMSGRRQASGNRALWAVECRGCGYRYDVPEGHYKNCPHCNASNRASQAVEKMEKPHDNIPKEKRMEYSKLPQEVKDMIDKAYMCSYCDIDEHLFETEDEKVIQREIENRIRQSFVQRLIEDDQLKIEKVKENHPGLHRRTIEAYVFQMDDWLDALIQVFWAGFDYHKEQTNQPEPKRLKDDGTP